MFPTKDIPVVIEKNLIEGFPCGTNIQYVSRSHADVAFRKVISTSGNLKGKIVGSPFFLIWTKDQYKQLYFSPVIDIFDFYDDFNSINCAYNNIDEGINYYSRDIYKR